MSFTLSSTTITQSGTDANLSGLSAIAGVTTTTRNNVKVYDLGSTLRLRVTGTLSHDPDQEVLIVGSIYNSTTTSSPISVASGGVYNYGKTYTANGVTNYATGTGIYLTYPAVNFFNNYGFAVESGGRLNWYGGVINAANLVYVSSGATLDQYEGTFLNTNATIECQFRSNASSSTNAALLTIRGLTLDGISVPATLFLQNGAGTGVFKLKNCSYQPISGTNNTISFTNLDNATNRSTKDLYVLNPTATNVVGILTFTGVARRLNYAQQTTNGSYGYCETRKDVAFTPVTSTGANITKASYYGVDITNVTRRVAVNNVADRTAQITYGANNATFPATINFLVETCDFNGTATPNILTDSRTNTSNAIPLLFMAFGTETNTFSPSLLGTGTGSSSAALLPDSNVVASEATIRAYTEVDTAEKFYDAYHVWALDNFHSTVYVVGGALSHTKRITRVGDTIYGGTYNTDDTTSLDTNIVIDATASAPLSVSGNVITIRATTFQGNLEMSGNGVVTLANGAVVSGFISDPNGDSSLTFSGADSWVVFATQADVDANTNPVASGGSTESFRFTFSGTTTYYLRLTLAGNTYIRSVTPTAAGVTDVSLSTESLLSGITSLISDRLDVVLSTRLSTADATINQAALIAEHDATQAALSAVPGSVWDVPYASHTTAGTMGKLMDTYRKQARAIEGQTTGVPTDTVIPTTITGYPEGAFDHEMLIVDATGIARPILSFAANGTITLQEALPSAPAAGQDVIILPTHVHPIADIQAGLATATDVAALATDVWAEEVEPGFPAARVLRVAASAVAGRTTGGPTGFVSRNLTDTADQITGTADASGNRSAPTYGV